MTAKRRIVACISDSHSGFELGLTNPETFLEDKKGHKQLITGTNESQTWLWEVYMNGLARVKELAGDDEIVILHTGDMGHGNKHPQELTSTRMANQVAYAYYSLLPWYGLKNVKSVCLAFGTGAHNFQEGSLEILTADRLRGDFPEIGTQVLYHGIADIDGCKIDFAHHGPHPGSRNWLNGNVARLYLESLMMDELDHGCAPPNIVLRGHFHTFVKTWFCKRHDHVDYESWLVVMPPLCLPGDWTHQATRSVYRVSPGIVAIEVIDGKPGGIYPFTQSLDIRTVITL